MFIDNGLKVNIRAIRVSTHACYALPKTLFFSILSKSGFRRRRRLRILLQSHFNNLRHRTTLLSRQLAGKRFSFS